MSEPENTEESVAFRMLTLKLLCVLLTHLTFNKHCYPSSLKPPEKALISKNYMIATQNLMGALNGPSASQVVELLNNEFKVFRAALEPKDLEDAIGNPLIMVPHDSSIENHGIPTLAGSHF